uniref:Uncharacterized protein n=1 Tax=Oryza glumipatula TaxID=40148 RepID=A0A0E0BU00_9ORYZ
MSAAAADTVSGDDHHLATGGDSACSTPFVSAPSSPAARDAPFPGGFFSAPASPAHHHHHHGGEGGGDGEEYEFEFDFSSRFPSPAPAAMSSADELFHNGQIRPMRLPPHPLQLTMYYFTCFKTYYSYLVKELQQKKECNFSNKLL